MKYISRSNGMKSWQLWVAAALILGLAACGSDEPEQEQEQEQGQEAASCSVEEAENGQVLVTCPDGTMATISGPTSDATTCSYDESNGEVRISCDDGTDVVIQDGVDGESGSSCSVQENPDGTATIACDDGSSTDIGTPSQTPVPTEMSMELLAGVTSVGTSDGIGTETRMDGALDGVYDPSGEFMFFVDTFNMTIRRFGLRTQRVVTLAGQAGQKGASDGIGTQATFEGPRGIAIHPEGERLFIADGFNCTIREMNVATHEVTTLTGQAGECGAVDGDLQDARFRLTIGMVMESSGRYLYVADRGNNAIRRIDLNDGVVETIAGQLPDPMESGNQFRGHADGVEAAAQFAGPGGIDLAEDEETLYINDTFNSVIRSLALVDKSASGGPELHEVMTIAGSPGESGNVDAVGGDARFQISQGIARAEDGLFVAGFHNTIRRIDINTLEVTTVAGQTSVGGSADGPYFDARFGVSFGILAHPDGRRVYYMDRSNNSIRLYDRLTRSVSTVMGAPEPTEWRNGEVGESRMSSPRGVVSNAEGTRVYVADRSNQVIRLFDSETGILSTLAGLPGGSGFANGVADEARFHNPQGLWLNSDESSLFVADSGNDAIRRVDLLSSEVTTVVGRPLVEDETSTDGTLEEALLDSPFGIVGYEGGSAAVLYVTDYGSDLVRRVDLGGDVTTMAGGGEADPMDPSAIDGVASDAIFDGPTGVAVTADGETLYVADESHHVIRRIVLSTGQVETIVGDIGVRDSFDGVGQDATFNRPAHIVLTQGDEVLLVSDRVNYAIRHVDLAGSAVTTLVGDLGTSGGTGFQFTPLDEARLYFTSGVTVAGDDVILTADQALLRVAGILGD